MLRLPISFYQWERLKNWRTERLNDWRTEHGFSIHHIFTTSLILWEDKIHDNFTWNIQSIIVSTLSSLIQSVTGLLELSHDHGHEQKMVSIFALLSSNAGGKKNWILLNQLSCELKWLSRCLYIQSICTKRKTELLGVHLYSEVCTISWIWMKFVQRFR